MRSAEVVVIGAGVVGASVAYHLAAGGCGPVLVLERGRGPGRGSTGRATGGFRAQFGSGINVGLSLLSREKLRRFEEELGVDPGFRPRGYLFLAADEAQLEALREARGVQEAAGFEEAREVKLAEIAEINPAVRVEGLAGGVYGPTDGFIRPTEILRGYVEGAERLGVEFEYGAACEGFEFDGEGISAVRTRNGEVAAGAVINAAGPWAGVVAREAGIDLPVRPLRRQVAITHPFDALPEEMPMTVFVVDGFHLRVRDGRVMLLLPDDPDAEDPFDQSVEESWLASVLETARSRLPCLEEASIDRERCWAGLYEMSPDGHALLGGAEEVRNFYLANGSSGHGVMHAPALGQLLAEVILDGAARTLDAHALRPSRFVENEPNLAPTLL
ncbi:MAG: FAD-binding oxidoreductase [Actinomycetota bacterium]|nr:FAD-binding oxidoreductase [Actinomycetota bacterium]